MIKRGFVLTFAICILISLFAGFAFAVNETNGSVSVSQGTSSSVSVSNIDKAYQCLENLVKNTSNPSLQEAFFGTLALGSRDGLMNKIESEKLQNCWPKAGCKLKETAQGVLAYRSAGKNSDDAENWLISKNATSADLIWFLEVDIANHVQSTCKISYDTSQNTVIVKEDQTVQGNPGLCLSVSPNGYWLRIAGNCLDKELQISCDQDFITSLIYQKNNGETVYVSSDTHSAVSLGTTKEKVKAKCFKTGTACDYEGSLWAALALSKTGNDVSAFLPYLMALAEDNSKYLPSSFLYIISGSQDQYTQLIQNQKQNKFWEVVGGANNRFYDTSLAMLALQDTSAAELENAKNYLSGIQTEKGCWNNDNLRDTAFILYSGWPRTTSSAPTIGGSSAFCEQASLGYSCEKASDCNDAGGRILYNFECSDLSKFCCTVKATKQSCNAKGGLVCSSSQRCSGSVISSSEGSCCLGACLENENQNICESSLGGICRSSCDTNEETLGTSTSCGISGNVCCIAKESSGGISWTWIIIIMILILIVLIAIVYRKKFSLWFSKGGAKSSTVIRPSGPGFGASLGARPGFGHRFMPSRPVERPVQKAVVKPNDEMEETFKKLREMSK